jgi:hypothetical protein
MNVRCVKGKCNTLIGTTATPDEYAPEVVLLTAHHVGRRRGGSSTARTQGSPISWPMDGGEWLGGVEFVIECPGGRCGRKYLLTSVAAQVRDGLRRGSATVYLSADSVTNTQDTGPR